MYDEGSDLAPREDDASVVVSLPVPVQQEPSDQIDPEEVVALPEVDRSGPIKRTPLPKLQTFVLCLVITSDACAITMLFSFLNQMVAWFYGFDDSQTEEIGFYSGYLGSAFFFSQTVSSYFWGLMSDKVWFGKKLMLQVGLSATIISVILFGFSTSFQMAMLARIIWGLFNSNFPTAKSIIYLMCDDTNRAQGFSLVGFCWAFGTIIGPTMGGLTAERIWLDSYPYALPCLITAAMCSVSLAVMTFFLQEPKRQRSILIPEEVDEEVELQDNALIQTKDEIAPTAESNGEEKADIMVVEEEQRAVPLHPAQPKQNAKLRKFIRWLKRNYPLLLALISYALVSFTVIAFDELFPLWAITPIERYGLSFTSSDIGYSWIIVGIGLLFFQSFCYARLANFIGVLWSYRVGVVLGVVTIGIYPVMSLIRSLYTNWVFWVLSSPIFTGRSVFATMMFTSANLLVANSSLMEIGKTNGVAATVGGIMKALGPAVVTNIYAFCTTRELPFPVNFYGAFLFLLVCCFMGLPISWPIPSTVGFSSLRVAYGGD